LLRVFLVGRGAPSARAHLNKSSPTMAFPESREAKNLIKKTPSMKKIRKNTLKFYQNISYLPLIPMNGSIHTKIYLTA